MKIFISYRQNDSPGDCRQLSERLQQSFGRDNVFFDIESIKLGDNWWAIVGDRIRSSDVVLVPIGQNWLTVKDKNGRRRLDDARDPLRREISLALKEHLRTIPVLVEGASMPEADQLPEGLREFADLSCCELRHRSFTRDVDALIEALGGTSGTQPRAPEAGTDVLSVMGKSFIEKLGERFAAAAAPAARPTPAAPAYAPPSIVNVAGTWQSPNGATHVIWQQGSTITIESRNQFGVVAAQGQGTLNGNQLYIVYNVSYQPPFVVRGEARGLISNDGMFITGQSGDPVVGVQPLHMRRVG